MVPRILGIIQARVGSSRFPSKVTQPLGKGTVLDMVIGRVKASKRIEKLVIATPYTPRDVTAIAPICVRQDAMMFCGEEHDVLNRYYSCAKELNPTVIVRITADCPLIDPQVIDATIEHFLANECDYVSNRLEAPGYPDGQDVEVFTMDSLVYANGYATEQQDREHVTPFIKAMCRCLPFHARKDMLDVRMTLDTRDDYEQIKGIVARLTAKHGEKVWKLKDILKVMEWHK
jgi:spore coat polysaccharide biosynthesis protein SpsF (cytidylyltransferase family)